MNLSINANDLSVCLSLSLPSTSQQLITLSAEHPIEKMTLATSNNTTANEEPPQPVRKDTTELSLKPLATAVVAIAAGIKPTFC
jgi:hypothetical protein